MRTRMTSNWRPLLRAFYAFVIAIAVLWAMPRNAHAQLYVTLPGPGIVSEYSATSGQVINANFITGLNIPTGLAVKGNTLFVENFIGDTVGEYDATTGATINANFITGLDFPEALAVSGNTLFVTNSGSTTVGEYDANTGTPIATSFITGLSGPVGLALRGNTLFVLNFNGTVGEYDATTGATINANFITGLPFIRPFGLQALALLGNKLFVADPSNRTVGEYDAKTGAAINANFIMGLVGLDSPFGIAVKSAK